MKKVVVKISYNEIQSNGTEEDSITFKCPYKGYEVTVLRDDLENYVLANQIDEEEFINLEKGYITRLSDTPIEFTLIVDDAEYKYLFVDFINYTKDKKDEDLTKLFTFLELKIMEIYNDADLYKKYLNEVDLTGDIDGCTFCKHYLKEENYCTRFSIQNLKKNCIFYSFNKKVKK